MKTLNCLLQAGRYLYTTTAPSCCIPASYCYLSATLQTISIIVVNLQNNRTVLTCCWPCISVYLSQYLTKLMHKICFTISFISNLYMFRAHVLIIRRSKLQETATYRCDDTRGCVMQFWPPDDEHMCSKHVEVWNKTYCETNFVHQVG